MTDREVASAPVQVVYRPEIDGLRALAVGTVVLNHAGFGPPAGYVGVDVFFVISGYLITWLLWRERQASGRIGLAAFYVRRVRRIVPALVTVIVATALAAILWLPWHGPLGAVLDSAAAALVFVGNLYFEAHTGGYFDPAVETLPLLHLWSFGVEEQFYVFWPLLLIVLGRRPAPVVRKVVVGLALLSLAQAEWLLYAHPGAAFFWMPPRGWELLAGALVALLPERPVGWLRHGLPVGIGLVLLANAVPLKHFPGTGALAAVAGTALALAAIHAGATGGVAGEGLRWTPVRWLGRISYSLYLWHWPLLALWRATHVGMPGWPDRAGLVLLALLFAEASYRWIEQPCRHGALHTGRLRLLGATLAMLGALCVFGHQLGELLYEPLAEDTPLRRVQRDLPPELYTCHYRGFDAPEPMPKPDCPKMAGSARVVIWGDSMALAWLPFAQTLAARSGTQALGYTRDACLPVPDTDNGKSGREAGNCRQFNRLVLQRLMQSEFDTLIVAARWYTYALDDGVKQRLIKTLHALRPRVRHIVLIGPTPTLRDAAPVCLTQGEPGVCAQPRAEFDRLAGPARQLLGAVAGSDPAIEFLDPADFFCDAGSCPAQRSGYALYWDDSHIASTAARDFAARYAGGAAQGR